MAKLLTINCITIFSALITGCFSASKPAAKKQDEVSIDYTRIRYAEARCGRGKKGINGGVKKIVVLPDKSIVCNNGAVFER